MNGKLVWRSDSKYRINWSKRAPSKNAQLTKEFIHRYFPCDIWFEEYVLPGGRLRVDFLNATRKFAIEQNGKFHSEYTPFFHKNRIGYADSFKRDLAKAKFLEANNYQVVDIEDEDFPLTTQFFQSRGILV